MSALRENKIILILSNSDAGLYEFRKEVVTAFINNGYKVSISVPDTGYVDKLAELGAEIYPTQMDRRGMNPVTDLKLYNYYKKLIRDVDPCAVLTYTIKPNVYGGVAARHMHVPCFNNVTGLGSTLQGSGPVQKFVAVLYKFGLKGAACVFFQNEYNLDFMIKAGCISEKQHTRLLPGSGVNLEEHKFQAYPGVQDADNCQDHGGIEIGADICDLGTDDKIHILNIGRIMDDKGSSELLEAAENIHRDHPEVVFDILGNFEDETKEKYEPWINRLAEMGIVNYYGFRDDVDDFYGNCHALVHPSYHEGMSNVVLEAAAAGRPVLTSDIPGCREIYEDGVGGIGFEPKSRDALITAIETFLNKTNEERAQMGLAARKYVEEHFDRKIVTEAYLEEVDKRAD